MTDYRLRRRHNRASIHEFAVSLSLMPSIDWNTSSLTPEFDVLKHEFSGPAA